MSLIDTARALLDRVEARKEEAALRRDSEFVESLRDSDQRLGHETGSVEDLRAELEIERERDSHLAH
jgi:hypothetical protein